MEKKQLEFQKNANLHVKRNFKNLKRRIIITRVRDDGTVEKTIKEKGVF